MECLSGIAFFLLVVGLVYVLPKLLPISETFSPRAQIKNPTGESNNFSAIAEEVQSEKARLAREKLQYEQEQQRKAEALRATAARIAKVVEPHEEVIYSVLSQLGKAIWEKPSQPGLTAFPYYHIVKRGGAFCLFGHGQPQMAPFSVEIRVEDFQVCEYHVGRLHSFYDGGGWDGPSTTTWYVRSFRIEPTKEALIEGLKLANTANFNYSEERLLYSE